MVADLGDGLALSCDRGPRQALRVEQKAVDENELEDEGNGEGEEFAAPEQRYELMQVLATGRMGDLRAAWDGPLKRKVAFKRMGLDVAEDHKLSARFLREMHVTAQLEHPSVVPIYADEIAADGIRGYAMRLVSGRSLTKLIDEETREARTRTSRKEQLALMSRLEVFLRVCDAVGYAHAKGVLHRDLKPENILLGGNNEVYVMDWSISRAQGFADYSSETPEATDATDDDDGKRTRVGSAVGTPAYMSPEQAQGKNDMLDGSSDQFSLGLILFELVTLRRARSRAGVKETMKSAALGTKQPLEHIHPVHQIPSELRAVIEQATAPAVSDRYASVEALAEDVHRYLRGQSVSARKDTRLEGLQRYVRLHAGGTIESMVIAIALGLSLSGLAVLWGFHHAQVEAQHAQKIAALVAQTGDTAQRIDGHLQRVKELSRMLAAQAASALSQPYAGAATIELTDDFDSAHPPEGAQRSSIYGRAITVDEPAFKLAPGVTRESVQGALYSLAQLKDTFRALVRATLPDNGADVGDDEFRKLVVGQRLPILRQFCSLASGLHEVYPGQGGLAGDYDARTQPAYLLGAESQGPTFAKIFADAAASTDVLPAISPIRDEGGKLRGVCGIELPIAGLRERFLSVQSRPGALEALLLDDDGHVIAKSDGAPAEERWPEFTAAFDWGNREKPQLQHSGTVSLSGHRLAAYAPLRATGAPIEFVRGWRYIVIVDLDKLFE
jgi:serine/threonine protein kinase